MIGAIVVALLGSLLLFHSLLYSPLTYGHKPSFHFSPFQALLAAGLATPPGLQSLPVRGGQGARGDGSNRAGRRQFLESGHF